MNQNKLHNLIHIGLSKLWVCGCIPSEVGKPIMYKLYHIQKVYSKWGQLYISSNCFRKVRVMLILSISFSSYDKYAMWLRSLRSPLELHFPDLAPQKAHQWSTPPQGLLKIMLPGYLRSGHLTKSCLVLLIKLGLII